MGLVNITTARFTGGLQTQPLPFTPTNGNTLIFSAVCDSDSYTVFNQSVFCGSASIPIVVRRKTGSNLYADFTVFMLVGGSGYTNAIQFTPSGAATGVYLVAEYSNVINFDGSAVHEADLNDVSRDTNVFSGAKPVTPGATVVAIVGLGRSTRILTPAPAEMWNERAYQTGVTRTAIWLGDKVQSTSSAEFNGTLDADSSWAMLLHSFIESQRIADLSVLVTDHPSVVVEPDRLKFPGLAIPSLYRTTASSLKSSTVDFGAQGVAAGDVLEILEGPNRGHYVIRSVQGTIVFVAQQLLFDDATPVAAVVRPQRNLTAQRKAAVVVSQPAFNQGFSMAVGTDILIS